MTAAERRFKDRKTFKDARVLHMFADALLVHIEVSAACVYEAARQRQGAVARRAQYHRCCDARRREVKGREVM